MKLYKMIGNKHLEINIFYLKKLKIKFLNFNNINIFKFYNKHNLLVIVKQLIMILIILKLPYPVQ